jgi:hypothetical protein
LKGFKVTGYFYNPNIHPILEFNERRKAIKALDPGIEIIYPDYLPEEFFQAVHPRTNLEATKGFISIGAEISLNEEAPARCAICWRQRLAKTAAVAKEKGYKYFSTTLLVSPYQNHEQLKDIGESIANEAGVEFYYADFRPGFRKARDEARLRGIYMQKYCGCVYSNAEKNRKKVKCVN